MQRSDFHYDLPAELIAQEPLSDRTASRMLAVDGVTGRFSDQHFSALPDLLRDGDLLVLNDTRVIPARLRGRKASGGRVEILIERITSETTALAQVRASKTPRSGGVLQLADTEAVVRGRNGAIFVLDFASSVHALLESAGEVPLPPYIERAPADEDAERYQTVYASDPGAVAAPTAAVAATTGGLLQRPDRRARGLRGRWALKPPMTFLC